MESSHFGANGRPSQAEKQQTSRIVARVTMDESYFNCSGPAVTKPIYEDGSFTEFTENCRIKADNVKDRSLSFMWVDSNGPRLSQIVGSCVLCDDHVFSVKWLDEPEESGNAHTDSPKATPVEVCEQTQASDTHMSWEDLSVIEVKPDQQSLLQNDLKPDEQSSSAFKKYFKNIWKKDM